MKYPILLLALIFSDNLMASEWIKVDSGEGVTVYVDKSSITFDKKIRKAWVMFSYEKPIKDNKGIEYNQAKDLAKYNCSNFTVAYLQSNTYMGTEVISSYTYLPNRISFSDIVPDSFGESISKFVCNTK